MTTLQAGPWVLDTTIDADVRIAMRQWMADPVVTRSIGHDPSHLSDSDFAAIVAQHDGRTGWMFFARAVDTKTPQAYVSILVSPADGIARLDILVGDRRAHARSLLNHATRALMPWMFEYLKVRKINVTVRADNHVTVAWLRHRMTLEGVLRKEMALPDGTGVDMMRFGLLADEWQEAVRLSETAMPLEWRRSFRADKP